MRRGDFCCRGRRACVHPLCGSISWETVRIGRRVAEWARARGVRACLSVSRASRSRQNAAGRTGTARTGYWSAVEHLGSSFRCSPCDPCRVCAFGPSICSCREGLWPLAPRARCSVRCGRGAPASRAERVVRPHVHY